MKKKLFTKMITFQGGLYRFQTLNGTIRVRVPQFKQNRLRDVLFCIYDSLFQFLKGGILGVARLHLPCFQFTNIFQRFKIWRHDM